MKLYNIRGKAPYRYCNVVPTTKWENNVIEWTCKLGWRPTKFIEAHPIAGELLYGKRGYGDPEILEVLFVLKLFSMGNLEKGAIRAAGWLRRHKLEAGYDPATGRIHVWPK